MASESHSVPSHLQLARTKTRIARDAPAIEPTQFTARIRAFQLELLQIDHGKFSATGSQARVGDVLVGRAAFGPATVQTWTSPPCSLTLVVKRTDTAVLWQGIDFRSSDVLLVGASTKVELAAKAGFGIAAATLFDVGSQRAEQRFGQNIFDRKLMLVRSQNLAALSTMRSEIDALLTRAPAWAAGVEDRTSAATDSNRLLSAAADAIANGTKVAPLRRGTLRAQAIERALRAIREQPAEHLTLSDLCRITGMSERTLRIAFIERYMVPPARFMKAYRLNHLREDLAELAARGPRISQVANAWGFWHLGQLAHDYHEWFGELPSVTYRRNLRPPPFSNSAIPNH